MPKLRPVYFITSSRPPPSAGSARGSFEVVPSLQTQVSLVQLGIDTPVSNPFIPVLTFGLVNHKAIVCIVSFVSFVGEDPAMIRAFRTLENRDH